MRDVLKQALGLCVGAVSIGLAASSASAAVPTEFDRVFTDQGEPTQTHYVASYRLGDGAHRVEVWRDHDRRLRRRTDDAIETLVVRRPGSVEWSMSVLDLRRKIRTEVDRTSLFRIGHFTDWFALSHSLAHPVGAYTLSPLPSDAAPREASIAPCRWWALTQGASTSKVCWSSRQHMPLVITDASGVVQWKITALDTRPLADATFALDDRGFVRNDANQDIHAD